MNFEFSQNLQGFEALPNSSVSRVKFQNETVILCKCEQSGQNIGMKRVINLPHISQYTVRVTGIANNDRSFLTILDSKGKPLIKPQYLKSKEKSTCGVKFYPKNDQKIILGLFMGGDSIAVPGNYFMIHHIRISSMKKPTHTANQTVQNQDSLLITRSFETVEELQKEIHDPLRSNKTPMAIGEYAILKSNRENDDLYVLSHQGLRYINRIGNGLPSFFGLSLNPIPGKVMPIYDSSEVAQNDLDSMGGIKFYEPRSDYYYESSYNKENNIGNRDSYREGNNKSQDEESKNNKDKSKSNNDSSLAQTVNDNIYLYLDSNGYVRWLRYQPQK